MTSDLKNRIHSGSLILVNPDYGCSDLQNEMVTVHPSFPDIQLEKEAAHMLSLCMESIHGWDGIVPVSGYRPHSEQQKIFDDCLKQDGPEFTSQYVAIPGHSEHETGLAIDLGKKQEKIDFIRPDFPHEGICQVFRDAAAKFGFIERYAEEKQSITHISSEPWHFRYVGIPHAAIITQHHLSLEEYIDLIRSYPYELSQYYSSYSAADHAEYRISSIGADIPLPANRTVRISGDNISRLILTEMIRR
ncbi:MAG: D-alanyl-D-alanine carboxypeptidase family protein [Solobacterium sp.]|jgi:D-alanyl-D-alanine dipeptidase/carboxypeptidase|nr:D-alanyl-D-alanine carboxypeptidase family protein [Solobacterium sp.]MCH4222316.1 D-alanyl-D-alanine carboxypeptidase family protein [Solobacterium sp.]MCH4265643.1 D-alanyl-D-alanine carboxypeptidase family protein [Solobacterium sp.]